LVLKKEKLGDITLSSNVKSTYLCIEIDDVIEGELDQQPTRNVNSRSVTSSQSTPPLVPSFVMSHPATLALSLISYFIHFLDHLLFSSSFRIP